MFAFFFTFLWPVASDRISLADTVVVDIPKWAAFLGSFLPYVEQVLAPTLLGESLRRKF